MSLLITGGSGYIGSHACLSLLEKGEDIVILDNFSNSNISNLEAIALFTGISLDIYPNKNDRFTLYKGDIQDKKLLKEIFLNHDIDDVLHFAGLKSVADSIINPLSYFKANVSGSITLIEEMLNSGVNNLIFSSSATVYKPTDKLPLTEASETGSCINAYGKSKLMIEDIISSVHDANPQFSATILRYFNPLGSHSSAVIGESPNNKPNNIMPIICDVALKKIDLLSIYGSDYATNDGTALRDYIHISDLIDGHIAALLKSRDNPGALRTYNLGTGRPTSVLELVNVFQKVNDINIPYNIDKRRPGDVGICWSSTKKSNQELNWKAQLSVEDMCRDSYNWAKNKHN
ncbi:UDP-glucose 4-epimerase GalE [Gammaproteobacteria bacterium]|nr:UDP-glucose 4-epimerase GalE [Gammaproteobacteria bacterium]|tara:strand:+ start:3275 stop:4312 length:1038 start_codon:yes stop_codon:yes gene_type:complete